MSMRLFLMRPTAPVLSRTSTRHNSTSDGVRPRVHPLRERQAVLPKIGDAGKPFKGELLNARPTPELLGLSR